MRQNWHQWNRKAVAVLSVLIIIGIIAAIPVGAERWKVERSSKQVELVFDYRDLLQVAAYKNHPQQYVRDELVKMKAAGIGSMAVYETSLQELKWGGRISLYSSATLSDLQGKPLKQDENFTYLLFNSKPDEDALRPVIEDTFKQWGIATAPWSFKGNNGLAIETPVEDAMLKTMQTDPAAVQMLHDAGFRIVPRLSDRIPYNAEEVDKLMASYEALGVTRILFDGNAVKGFADNAEKKTLTHFAETLNKHGIGISTIENSKPQQGLGTLAYLTHYNVARLYSLPDKDAAGMKPLDIADRFQLAVKDRSIRMFYINAAPASNAAKSSITDPMDNIYKSLEGKDGFLAKLDKLGYEPGPALPFDYESPSWLKPLKALVALGAVAFIALLIQVFLPGVAIPVFLIGLIGSAGLYVLSKSIFEQGLALGAAISAPTLAMVWAIRRVRTHTVGNRRPIGATDGNAAARADGQLRWIFPGITAGRRLLMAVAIFATTSVISLCGIPFVVGLLNNITYKLVLEQFRGVSLLHLAPIALTALYLLLYTGDSVIGNIRKLLKMQITVLWVAVAAVVGVLGLYYLSRTGNEGSASTIELTFRNFLETTFGVRPRTKEFLLSHPLFFAGLFLALRYRAAWVLFIVGSIGQLSMVDTFAHIHTPLAISIIRDLLGLVLGALIGLVLIGVWQVLEGAWKLWAPRFFKAKPAPKSAA
ncbi:hypothetical protein SAMN02799624_03902 [Paenibacillus sp. UNC496MF]|uniref:DUF5693 family protein n=1 Tax=Paenibacillus sp. UNC496MF TaxID=1502753 RepID=UPI0008E7E943|nr:DUF5693 family protein [Paenibacillus sp. UNC496MF]SFJ26389.1 hypothetical protein SAMN02799624_03902 [Paenibacillus sp. UNC496MF]